MKVCFVSAAPEKRTTLIGFLVECLKRRGWSDVDVKRVDFESFALDQHGDPVDLVLLDLHPEIRCKPAFDILRGCNGDRPLTLCVYPAFAPMIADCAVGHEGAKACLHVPAEKLSDRDTVLRFLEEHLADLADPEPADTAPETAASA